MNNNRAFKSIQIAINQREKRLFFERLSGKPSNECWEWKGSQDVKTGFGIFALNGKTTYVHKTAYEIANGKQPARARTYHLCSSRLCYNPAHLSRSFGERFDQRFWSYVDIKNDASSCWEWKGGLSPNGYGKFQSSKGKTEHAHRIAWHLHNKEVISKGMHICHRCDNRTCCNPSHLFLGTPQDNVQDCIQKGRRNRPKGEKVCSAKISDELARKICLRLKAGEERTFISKALGVNRGVIKGIALKKTWKHIWEEIDRETSYFG